jgi:hypothetical protein
VERHVFEHEQPRLRIDRNPEPASGPGRAADLNYSAAVTTCRVDRQRVVGYVATKYTHKSIASVEAAIDTYYGFYPGLDGIFFDNMSLSPGANASCKGCTMTVSSYYPALYDHVHANRTNTTVVGNPGAPATTSWQLSTPVADAVVTFEGSTATADNAGLLFATDGKLKPNPYAALPSYWTADTSSR